MDLDVIKEQLGNFKTFVEAMAGLLKNFPSSLANIGALVDGKASLMAPSHAVNTDDGTLASFGEQLGAYKSSLGTATASKWVETTNYTAPEAK